VPAIEVLPLALSTTSLSVEPSVTLKYCVAAVVYPLKVRLSSAISVVNLPVAG
jgi:hypothetical protein